MTLAFFLVAVAHTALIAVGTPILLAGDLLIGLKGALEGQRRTAVAREMNCGYHWGEVSKSWRKVWTDD